MQYTIRIADIIKHPQTVKNAQVMIIKFRQYIDEIVYQAHVK